MKRLRGFSGEIRGGGVGGFFGVGDLVERDGIEEVSAESEQDGDLGGHGGP